MRSFCICRRGVLSMRIRIKFTKNEIVKYLGHLDIMRTFQRCFHRADVKMTYSEGFNPHQKMNFALPLGVGIASRGEYLDAEITDGQDPKLICSNLDMVTGSGFDILDVRALKENAEKAMASVRYASYEIEWMDTPGFDLADYCSQPVILIRKLTKSGEKDVDIKPMLVDMQMNGSVLNILMKAGSESNVKPELIAKDLMKFHELPYIRDQIRITRTELYAAGITPLIDYQTVL